MAKNNAKKTNRRRPTKKQSGLSRQTVIISAAIVIVLILALTLFALLHDDGALDVSNGVARTGGVNSLIVNEGSSAEPLYYKVGQLADVEGYALISSTAGDDENILYYSYTPEADGLVDQVLVDAGTFSATEYIDSLYADYSGLNDFEVSYPQATEVNGHAVYYMVYRTVDPAETTQTDGTAAENAGTDYIQLITASVAVGERSVVMTAIHDPETEAEYVGDAAMVEALLPFLSALSYETE